MFWSRLFLGCKEQIPSHSGSGKRCFFFVGKEAMSQASKAVYPLQCSETTDSLILAFLTYSQPNMGHQLWLYMKFTPPNFLEFQFQNSTGGPGLVWLDSCQFTQSSQGQAMLWTRLACGLSVLKLTAHLCSKQGCLGVSTMSTKHSQVPMKGSDWGTGKRGPKLSVVTPGGFFNWVLVYL